MSEEQNTGQFSKVIVTTVGKEMIAKSQNGQTLTFTRVALGDGLIANEDDPINFIKIKNERLSAPIAKYTDRGNGQFELQFRVSNKEVETGFWHREIGVMAKIDEGPEQLYAYTTAGNKASFLYDKTTPIEERIVNIAFVIGNAQNVQVIVNSSIIYVTLEDMEEAFDTHNNDINAHSNLIKNIFDIENATEDDIKKKIEEYAQKVCLPLSGGTMEGLVSLFTGSTVPTPAEQDNSKNITNTEWVQTWVKAFVAELSNNIEVETQEDGHFSCPALGITGLMAQNGYICLGKLFGNLILQWGNTPESNGKNDYKILNIPYSKFYKIYTNLINNTTADYSAWSETIDNNKFLIGIGPDYTCKTSTVNYFTLGI